MFKAFLLLAPSFPMSQLPHAALQSAVTVPDLELQVATLTARLAYTGYLITAVLLFFMALACIALWWSARTFHAFRSFGLYLLSVSSVFFAEFLRGRGSWSTILLVPTSWFLVEMAADVLGIRKRGWIWLNRVPCIVALLFAWSPLLPLLCRVTIDVSELIVLVLLSLGWIRGNSRDRLIASALAVIWFFRAPLDPVAHRYIPIGFRLGGWSWNIGPFAMSLFGAVAIASFVRDLIEDQRQKERLASELEAGRAMQQVLLDAEVPLVPGLRIESIYQPAGEVGGDFFVILPVGDDGLLIAVGDVSGKGLRAAMTVSSILGTLRAFPFAGPADLLSALNRTLGGRLQGGFVTCLCVRIGPGAECLISNAGHLAPYCNGEEVPIDSGLPLGISPDAAYAESEVHLAPGDQLTMLTDGVLEARNATTGELFGFERTRAISTQSAEHIAHAAKQFGQDDDITVLTLQFAPAEVLLA